jgi:Cu2+-exporting ATPase
MNSRLKDVAAAVRLSRATLRNIHENLFWAFFYNVICIPLAAGLYAWKMNPMVGAAAMSLSSFTVCMNALRLNLFNLHDSSKDRPLRKKALPYTEEKPAEPVTKAEPEAQKVTLHITGMMCPHCEATVEKALKQIEGVKDAKASHEQGIAEVTLNKDVDINVLNTAVIDAGYEITDTQEKEEEIRMEKVLHVEGMMCEHCEATVKKALEAIDGVESAVADHNANTATVTLSKDVADEVLKEAVEAKDYKVTGFGA